MVWCTEKVFKKISGVPVHRNILEKLGSRISTKRTTHFFVRFTAPISESGSRRDEPMRIYADPKPKHCHKLPKGLIRMHFYMKMES